MKTETSAQKKLKYAKRLKVVDSFRKSSNRPEWMILDVIPVIPPELRPLVPLDGGRFATSDLNDLYRRVINRNNRLKKLMELKAPDVIIRNEKRMLQEAVDALFDNGRRGRVLRGANNRPLKSLSDTLKGKQGRFRQNLLGKRVDYSGRSVIVVGPELKLHQCGLPKKMALELFKPFIYNKLEERGLVATIKQAKEMVELQRPEVWDVLEEVIREHPVLLNRAPTLHRLGIQAFEPVLVEGKAIRIHPLVCTAFNADFDGDQMAVHIPLSPEAQIEASVLMLSSNNILSPAHGAPIAIPSQDIVLGCYYLTKAKSGAKGEGRAFGNPDDVMLALEAGELETLSPIRLRYTGDLQDLTAARDDQDVLRTEVQTVNNKIINTTVGRVILNEALPPEMPFVNGLLKKKGLQQLVQTLLPEVRAREDRRDARLAQEPRLHLRDAVGPVDRHRRPDHPEGEGARSSRRRATRSSRSNRSTSRAPSPTASATTRSSPSGRRRPKTSPTRCSARWRRSTRKAGTFNPVYIMADSGARGSKQQIRQLAGMRGLMAKPSGEIIETPITANFREGLDGAAVLHLDARRAQGSGRHGAQDGRLGLPDAPSRRRRAGRHHLRARLRHARRHRGAGHRRERRDHRAAARPHHRPRRRSRGSPTRSPARRSSTSTTMIDEETSSAIQDAGIEKVKIRSVLTCTSRRGVCAKCYGRDLATGKMVELGQAVGVIAAQSIGEPGTQLTMRTFHIGGTASRVSEQSTLEARNAGTVRFQGPPCRPAAPPPGRSPAGGCGRCGPGESRTCRARRPPPPGAPAATGRSTRRWWRSRRWARRGRAGPAGSSSCRLRSGPGSRGWSRSGRRS